MAILAEDRLLGIRAVFPLVVGGLDRKVGFVVINLVA